MYINKDREKKIFKVTIVGALCNVVLVAFKFVAGIVGNSAAMVADAVHSLSDFVTDVIVLVFVKISNKPHDDEHRYGHGKFETLATVLVGLVLIGVGMKILMAGAKDIYSFFNGEMLDSPGYIALIVALLSIVVKEGLYHYTLRVGKRENSQVVVANAWHHRSDALSSIGVAVGVGGAILLGEKWQVLDSVAAVIVSVFILRSALQIMKPGFDELMEKSLPRDVEKRIEEIILSFDGVSQPHNLRTRRIGNYCAVDVHIRMDGRITLSEAHEKTTEIEGALKEYLGEGAYIYIHMEPMK